ncbi:nitrate reductase molybdenum cofactor assembly chaperone [Gracilibacillus marinus]|uniref:Nitrate reductase molybdenum cofactor assembly chaperone n=1 Tax=Gracilibacillus marinus TaxID=630535 RepID=A0ABV8VR12_9BACI
MREKEAELLLVAAHLLDYPSKQTIEMVQEWINTSNHWSMERNQLQLLIRPFQMMSFIELEKLYVNTFDLKAEIGLYLTAYEVGDSNKRGASLIQLQKIINQAGFERNDKELADYIPMLYELIAIMEETDDAIRLWKRLGTVTQTIYQNIPKTNLYFPIFELLMTYVFEAPSDKELEEMERNRETTDLAELPYPIMYN